MRVLNSNQEEFFKRKYPKKRLYRFPEFVATARQMGEAGFERIQKEFSEEKYISNLLTMVDEVVNSQERCRSKL